MCGTRFFDNKKNFIVYSNGRETRHFFFFGCSLFVSALNGLTFFGDDFVVIDEI